MAEFNLREKLVEAGASEVQMNAKVLTLAENVIAEASDEEFKEMGISRVGQLLEDLRSATNKIKSATNNLEYSINKAKNEEERISNMVDILKGCGEATITVLDDTTSQAIEVYKQILKATQEVFGTDLSDAVKSSAIEAGSYGAWRTIMGEAKSSYGRRER